MATVILRARQALKRALARAPALALALVAAGMTCAGSLDTTVKAVDLCKFAPFVDWPPDAIGPAHAPVVLCVVGNDPFGSVLDRAVARQQVGDHPILVRRMAVALPNPPCQIMFLGGSPTQPIAEALRLEQSAPVLTVTDGSNPAGIIDFVVERGRVRFRIDEAAAAAHGLTIRAQLLKLATSVTPRPRAH
jgi:YfiR/HmsC-like